LNARIKCVLYFADINYIYEPGEIQTFLHGLLVGGFVRMKNDDRR